MITTVLFSPLLAHAACLEDVESGDLRQRLSDDWHTGMRIIDMMMEFSSVVQCSAVEPPALAFLSFFEITGRHCVGCLLSS